MGLTPARTSTPLDPTVGLLFPAGAGRPSISSSELARCSILAAVDFPRERRDRRIPSGRQGSFVPRSAVQHSAGLLLVEPAPLLEKEWDPLASALVTNVDDPLRFH